MQTYALTSGIFEPKEFWAQSRAVTYDDSTAVGYVDNFSVGKNSPALAVSPANLLYDESNPDNNTGGSGQQDSGSSGSGGGAIGWLLIWLLIGTRTLRVTFSSFRR